MRLGHIEIFVSDAAESMRFYAELLGFDVLDIQEAGKLVWLRAGDVEILLRSGKSPHRAKAYGEAGIALVLYTPEVRVTMERLKAHGLEFRGDDGDDVLTFTDPDGHWIQLTSETRHRAH